ASATLARSRVGVVENPVFLAVRRFEKRIVPRPVDRSLRRLPEDRLLRFLPGCGIEQIAVCRCGQYSELVVVSPAPTSRIDQQDLSFVLENLRALVYVDVRHCLNAVLHREISYLLPGEFRRRNHNRLTAECPRVFQQRDEDSLYAIGRSIPSGP